MEVFVLSGIDLSTKGNHTSSIVVFYVNRVKRIGGDNFEANARMYLSLSMSNDKVVVLEHHEDLDPDHFENLRMPIAKPKYSDGIKYGCALLNNIADCLSIIEDIIGEKIMIYSINISVEDVPRLVSNDIKYGGEEWVKNKKKWINFIVGIKKVSDFESCIRVVEVPPDYTSLNCPMCNPPIGQKIITNPTFKSSRERETAAKAKGLGPRGFYCPHCGLKTDKDTVASLNIAFLSTGYTDMKYKFIPNN